MLTQQLFRRNLIVATNDMIESTGELRSTGGDPHFVLKPAEPLRRGWYAISLRGAARGSRSWRCEGNWHHKGSYCRRGGGIAHQYGRLQRNGYRGISLR
jgi:hypothetical protein